MDKVAAVDPDGRVTISMTSAKTAAKLGVRFLVQDALDWAKSIGRKFDTHKFDRGGPPGSYYAGHAEPQMIAWQNQELAGARIRGFAVSRAPCPESCSRVLTIAAQTAGETGVTYVVAYPGGVTLYLPTGEVRSYP